MLYINHITFIYILINMSNTESESEIESSYPEIINIGDTESENENENENENESSYSEEIPIKTKKKFKKEDKKEKYVSTEGSKIIQHGLQQCEYCVNFYDKRMIAISEWDDKICQHCYFFLNFTDPQPKYNWTLEKYVELCAKEHDNINCQRFANDSSCHLCMYLLDIKTLGGNFNKKQPEQKINKKNDINDDTRNIVFTGISNKKKTIISCDGKIVL
jgi:hypothetical protein